jgi:ribosomal protein L11 methyltransferase
MEEVEAGWEDRWRDFHQPVRVGPLWIGPPWDTPPDAAIPVVIDPGRAFGTGAHPTTRLCLEWLVALPRSSLLDVGCGSGVLAIAAVRLGYSPVSAVDVAPTAIEATRANAEANHVSVPVDAWVGDALARELPRAELVVANVTLDVAIALGSRVQATRFLTSGYLSPDRPVPRGYRAAGRRELEGWAADLFVPI